MGEIVQIEDQQNRAKKWSRAGTLIFWANLILSFYFLGQEIYLIPPLFHWSLPIYFLAWIPIIIFWVQFIYTYSGAKYSPFLIPKKDTIPTGIDLRGANLAGKYLRGFDLSGSQLVGVNLENANLSMADLSEANLSGADLTGANLTGADLLGANFESAVLNETDFTNAEVDLETLETAEIISEIILPDKSIYTR